MKNVILICLKLLQLFVYVCVSVCVHEALEVNSAAGLPRLAVPDAFRSEM